MVLSLVNSGSDFLGATVNSLFMIIVTELGDKTFFIAAVLAMRSGRVLVYAGAMIALAVMHVGSVLMGYALPSLLPRKYTHIASTLMFVYFGLRLLRDAYQMGEGPSDELQEVEEELIKKKEGEESDTDLEEAERGQTNFRSRSSEQLRVFTQALTLTFLAEWGDRSQIATIAMAATKNPYGVIIGGLVGHAFCTGLAVIGGRILAARISERTVAIIGGILFLCFALHSYIVGP